MKTVLHVVIPGPGKNGTPYGRGSAKLTIDLPFAPYPGMTIEHPAWHDGRKVVSVTLTLDGEAQSLFVFMGFDEGATTESQFQQMVEAYRAHGWEVRGD